MKKTKTIVIFAAILILVSISAISFLHAKDGRIKDEKLKRLAEKVNKQSVNAGDTIKFGRYEQDGDVLNGKEEIEWCILSVEDGKVRCISKEILDGKKFNDEPNTIPDWKTSSLRKWLNGEFFSEAFNNQEKRIMCRKEMQSTEKSVSKNSETSDIVWIPETDYSVLAANEQLCAAATEYAMCQGVMTTGYKIGCWWTQETDNHKVKIINPNGEKVLASPNDAYWGVGVRPEILIDFNL